MPATALGLCNYPLWGMVKWPPKTPGLQDMKAEANHTESSQGEFWDRRYSKEGAIWGEVPSPTAQTAARYVQPQDRVLDIGFGYGRDLPFFARQQCRVWGVDLSQEGCRRA